MKKKNVAVLTFIDTPNYGALLQAYALQYYLTSLGYKCELINYQNSARRFSQVSGIKRIRSIFYYYTLGKIIENKDRKYKTNCFRDNILKLTRKKYSNCIQLAQLNANFDIFIVGSDQVWNPKNNANDSAYLLSFVDSDKKILSYAASFGTDSIDPNYLICNSDFFRRFTSISVREESGKRILKNILGLTSEVVIDPVFLLSKDKWKNIANPYVDFKKEYVLCYVMPGNKKVENIIYKIAKAISSKTGAVIYTIGKKTSSIPYPGENLIHDGGPSEFLSYIIKSEYIITNSFHGTAFSIIHEKKFWSVMKKQKKSRNTRITNLLEQFDLIDRGVFVDDYSPNDDYLCNINYENVNPKIEARLIKSIDFLKRNMGMYV